jgi:hypothetical protein
MDRVVWGIHFSMHLGVSAEVPGQISVSLMSGGRFWSACLCAMVDTWLCRHRVHTHTQPAQLTGHCWVCCFLLRPWRQRVALKARTPALHTCSSAARHRVFLDMGRLLCCLVGADLWLQGSRCRQVHVSVKPARQQGSEVCPVVRIAPSLTLLPLCLCMAPARLVRMRNGWCLIGFLHRCQPVSLSFVTSRW